MATTESLTVYPASYDALSTGTVNAAVENAIGKGVDNTTPASWDVKKTTPLEAYYNFDLSAIPVDATIDSVSCVAKGYKQGVLTGTYQLFCGTTAKGTAVTILSEEITQLDCGNWTRSELDDCKICINISSNMTGTRTVKFYGAELTVTYTYSNQTFMLKTNGVWTEVSAVYKKADGAWVEQEDLQNLFDTSTNYVRGVVT